MWWFVVSEAWSCGSWTMRDLERTSTVTFLTSSVWERVDGGPSTIRMRLGEHYAPEAPPNELPALPPDVRVSWSVDVGDPLAMEGALLRRDGRPVGVWQDLHTLSLGTRSYRVVLEPAAAAPNPGPGPWYALSVAEDGEQILSGTASSLCTFQLSVDDQLREIRTRVAYWLAQTRSPPIIDHAFSRASLPPDPDTPVPSPAGRIDAAAVASTTLRSKDGRHGTDALGDGNPTTAWCEGAAALGTGSTLTWTLPVPTDPVLYVLPGYNKDLPRLRDNAQPRRLLVTTDTGVTVEVPLPYRRMPSDLGFRVPLSAPGTRRVTVELTEAWGGGRASDTCISEMVILSGP